MTLEEDNVIYCIDEEDPIYKVFEPVIVNIPIEKRDESLRMLITMFYELNRNIIIYQDCIKSQTNDLADKCRKIRELENKIMNIVKLNGELIHKINKYKKMLEDDSDSKKNILDRYDELKILNESNIKKLKDEKDRTKKQNREIEVLKKNIFDYQLEKEQLNKKIEELKQNIIKSQEELDKFNKQKKDELDRKEEQLKKIKSLLEGRMRQAELKNDYYEIEIFELKKYINLIMEEMFDNKIQEALRRY